jgi:hypothetical protein
MKFIVWKTEWDWKATTEENYNRYIQNAREIKTFNKRDGFESAEDVADYLKKWFGASEVIVINR